MDWNAVATQLTWVFVSLLAIVIIGGRFVRLPTKEEEDDKVQCLICKAIDLAFGVAWCFIGSGNAVAVLRMVVKH